MYYVGIIKINKFDLEHEPLKYTCSELITESEGKLEQ